MKKLGAQLLDRLRAEPAVVIGALASLIVLIAGHFHIIINKAEVVDVLAPVITGILIRPHVQPAAPPPADSE